MSPRQGEGGQASSTTAVVAAAAATVAADSKRSSSSSSSSSSSLSSSLSSSSSSSSSSSLFGSGGPTLTMAEVALHASRDDCWTVIHRKVYDVTPFFAVHPGGDFLLQAGGRDATALFESTHQEWVKAKHLASLYKGELLESDDAEPRPQLFYDWTESDFYPVLKRRVAKALADAGRPRHDNALLWAKAVAIVVAVLTLYWLTQFRGYFWTAFVWGYCYAQLGIGIMHDGNHGAFSANPRVCAVAGRVMDVIGGSSFIWKYEHNGAHHGETNLVADPDASTAMPFSRFAPEQPYRWYHRYQHYYTWLLYAAVSFKWVVSDIEYWWKRRDRMVLLPEPDLFERVSFVWWKSHYFIFHFALPYYFGVGDMRHIVLAWFAAMLVSGYTLALNFAVTHINAEVAFPETSVVNTRDWGKLQVLTAANYGCGSWWSCLASGGLNYQIEHHLFPSLAHVNHPYIWRTVRDTCREYGVPYRHFPSYAGALRSHFWQLYLMGLPPAEYTAYMAKCKQDPACFTTAKKTK